MIPNMNPMNLFAHKEPPIAITPYCADLIKNQVDGIATKYQPHHSAPSLGYLNCMLNCNHAMVCPTKPSKEPIPNNFQSILFIWHWDSNTWNFYLSYVHKLLI